MAKNEHVAALRKAQQNGVRVVDLQFTDLRGGLKSKTVSLAELEHEQVCKQGYGVDGSSLVGSGVPIEESDLMLVPDLSTLHPLPWAKDAARVICNVFRPVNHGEMLKPFEGDVRYILARNCEAMQEFMADCERSHARHEFHVAPELEFFVLSPDNSDIDNRGYFDAPPHRMRIFLTRIMEAMGEMGMRFEAYHHEVAPSQYEFDFRYGEALPIADATVTLKDIIRNYAEMQDLVATFMPKPFAGRNGSGMHCHLNISRYTPSTAIPIRNHTRTERKTNMFYDEQQEGLSETALHFIGGLMAHAPALTAITNPTCNSYKRIVPGWEAPTRIAWGRKNRTAAIRVPYGNPRATRCEYRAPDPSANPYLAFAAMLAAGMDGIKRKSNPGKPCETSLYHGKHNIASLPASLGDALDALESGRVIQRALGSHATENYLRIKREEVAQYEAAQRELLGRKYSNRQSRLAPNPADFKFYIGV